MFHRWAWLLCGSVACVGGVSTKEEVSSTSTPLSSPTSYTSSCRGCDSSTTTPTRWTDTSYDPGPTDSSSGGYDTGTDWTDSSTDIEETGDTASIGDTGDRKSVV